MANDKHQIWVILGIALLVIFAGKNYFIGSLVTTCENNELSSIEAFRESIEGINGTVDQIDPFAMQTTIIEEFQAYKTESSLGRFDIISPGDYSCQQFLARVDAYVNGTSYFSLDRTQILIVDDSYMWCNRMDNFVLRTGSTITFSNYREFYITCVEEEVQGPIGEDSVDTSSEDDADDIGADTPSYLPDAVREAGETNQTTNNTAAPIPPITITETDLYSTEEKIAYAGIVALIVFMIYWFFEKGPDKGLFQKKRRKRK
jgi:hypothetical protein